LRPWDDTMNQVALAEFVVNLAINVHPDSTARAQGRREQGLSAQTQCPNCAHWRGPHVTRSFSDSVRTWGLSRKGRSPQRY
jgi:hypothetical protein